MFLAVDSSLNLTALVLVKSNPLRPRTARWWRLGLSHDKPNKEREVLASKFYKLLTTRRRRRVG